MPSKDAHISAAKANQHTIDYLAANDEHMPWVVTVAFYKALHIIEAVLDADPACPIKHTDDHKTRNNLLKRTNRYRNLWQNYRPLWEASLIARCLRANEAAPSHDVFSTYMPANKVRSLILGHYLAQIESSAAKILGNDFLTAQPKPKSL
jgi:hypothetical protein